jgi:hypothetical protein
LNWGRDKPFKKRHHHALRISHFPIPNRIFQKNINIFSSIITKKYLVWIELCWAKWFEHFLERLTDFQDVVLMLKFFTFNIPVTAKKLECCLQNVSKDLDTFQRYLREPFDTQDGGQKSDDN